MKRILPLIVGVSLLFSGCGNFYSAISGDISTNTEVTDATVPIRFSWWGNDNRHEYTMNGVKIFEEENPTIDVRNSYGVWQGFEKRMQVAMKSHTEADVMQINYAWIDQYSPDGEGFYDLNQLTDYIDLSNFTDNDIKYGIKNGKLNALPVAFNCYEFFYNELLWDKYNLEFPDSWDEIFEAAKVMQKDGIYPLGIVKKHAFMMTISWFEQTHGKTVFNDDGELNIDAHELGEMIGFYGGLVKEKVIIPIDDFNTEKFADGKVAATMGWISDAGNYCGALEKKGGSPKIGGYIISENARLTGWYIKPATLYAISVHTEYPEEAAKLLDFLLNSPEMAKLQLAEKGVPVSNTAYETLKGIPDAQMSYEFMASEYMNANIDKLSIIKPIMENEDVIKAFKECGDEYIYNDMPLDECGRRLQDTINEVYKEQY